MSVRNPKTGKRAKVRAGDRLIFTLPPGPPALAVDMYGGDVQAAVTAALTLLAVVSSGAVGALPAPPQIRSPAPESLSGPGPTPDPLAGVMTQSLYDS